jgi:type II secretory pathway pseudopilin PulG
MQQRSNQKKGFSLIEAAIVLAVVGGVIGAIWVVTAKMIEDYKITKLTNGLILGANKLINNISDADIAAMPKTGVGYAHLTSYCVAAKIFPEDFYSGNKILTPFDGDDSLDVSEAFQNTGTIFCHGLGGLILISVVVPRKAICLKMTYAISSRFHDDTSLDNISVGGYDNIPSPPGWSGTTYTSWPLSLSGTHCNAKYPASIRLNFKPLRRN